MSALIREIIEKQEGNLRGIFGTLRTDDLYGLLREWPQWAEAGQRAPEGDWQTWLMMAGRGFGKTRAGAEWVRGLAESDGALRIALIGGTVAEVREVMVEGESGLLTIAPYDRRPAWEPTRGRLVWPNGAQAAVYSGENPERLRGPEHHFAWCDELAKWTYPDQCWDNLQLGMRKGVRPRTLITTTPRAIPLIRRLVKSKRVVVTGGGTRDNAHLSPSFIAAVEEEYGGTRLGRQELEGALLEDVEGALWTRALIERCRVRVMPTARRVVVGVDPPAGIGGDACGIVVVALGGDARGYVIADESVAGASPEGWAAAVAAAAAVHGADRVIAEANQGGAMVETVLRAADLNMPVRLVHASRGKSARAEPVAALYGSGRVSHCGAFPALEDELCGLIAGGGYDGPGRSPDRADALVWALTELMLGKRRQAPRVRVV